MSCRTQTSTHVAGVGATPPDTWPGGPHVLQDPGRVRSLRGSAARSSTCEAPASRGASKVLPFGALSLRRRFDVHLSLPPHPRPFSPAWCLHKPPSSSRKKFKVHTASEAQPRLTHRVRELDPGPLWARRHGGAFKVSCDSWAEMTLSHRLGAGSICFVLFLIPQMLAKPVPATVPGKDTGATAASDAHPATLTPTPSESRSGDSPGGFLWRQDHVC